MDSVTKAFVAMVGVGAALVARPAAAHIETIVPPQRYATADYIKYAPCGPGQGEPETPSGAVTTYQAGETITVEVDEFIGHQGSIRVAIDPTGTDTFEIPTGFDDLDGPNVLASFDDPDGPGYKMLEVTLPDEPCDPCVLQVIQIMEEGAFGVDDMYFQCSDIDVEAAAGSDDGPGDDSGGGDTTGPDGGDDEGDTGSTGGGGDGVDDGADDGVDDGGDGADDGGDDGGATDDGLGSDGTAGDGGGSDDDSGGCGCRTDGAVPGGAWWLGLPLVLVVRRRRRPA